jgi:polyketide synthase 5
LAALALHSPFAHGLRTTDENSTGSAKLRAELNQLAANEWPMRLRRLISDQVSLILRRSIDPDRALSEYGLDSMGALELRTRIEIETGVRISPADITTIHSLAELLRDRLVPA